MEYGCGCVERYDAVTYRPADDLYPIANGELLPDAVQAIGGSLRATGHAVGYLCIRQTGSHKADHIYLADYESRIESALARGARVEATIIAGHASDGGHRVPNLRCSMASSRRSNSSSQEFSILRNTE
jgi:hypothetical protein